MGLKSTTVCLGYQQLTSLGSATGFTDIPQGATLALEALGLQPYFDLNLRLGEGSGAALALPLIDAACAVHNEMATLAECQIAL